jgi:hypothetical protein
VSVIYGESKNGQGQDTETDEVLNMNNAVSFAEILEAADRLSPEDQETLIDILHRRAIENRRQEIAKDIRDAQQEFRKGRCRATTPTEIMKEILS